jgi:hypothetical protein
MSRSKILFIRGIIPLLLPKLTPAMATNKKKIVVNWIKFQTQTWTKLKQNNSTGFYMKKGKHWIQSLRRLAQAVMLLTWIQEVSVRDSTGIPTVLIFLRLSCTSMRIHGKVHWRRTRLLPYKILFAAALINHPNMDVKWSELLLAGLNIPQTMTFNLEACTVVI